MKFTIFLLALICSGCVAVWGSTYKVTFQDEEKIIIRYDTALISSSSIQNIAKEHCDKYSKLTEITYSKMPAALLGILEESYMCIAKPIIQPKAIKKKIPTFGAWEVSIKIDDFEGEVQPTLSSEIVDVNGNPIGKFKIGYFTNMQGEFLRALVSINVKGLDNTWPDCDYEYTKYKIDNGESKYYPTAGHACPALIFNKKMASSFIKGSTFRFSASRKTGIVDLTGFSDAWSYSLKKQKVQSK